MSRLDAWLLAAALFAIPSMSLFGVEVVEDVDNRVPVASLNVWSGWRGATANGQVTQEVPTRWNADHGVRWKTPVPGLGHSSPIVFGNRAFVTTAYGTVKGIALQHVLRTLMGILLLVVAALVLRTVTGSLPVPSPPTWRTCVSHISMMTAVMLLAIVLVSGEALFDLARSPIRLWLVSTLVVSICLGLAALGADRTLRLGIGATAALFAGFSLWAIPHSEYAFRGGLPSLRMQIVMATSAVPLLVGAAALCGAGGRRRGVNRVVLAVSAATATALLLTGAWLLLYRLLVFRDDGFPETAYSPRVTPWLLVLLLPTLVFAWRTYRRRRQSPAVRLAVGTLGAVSLVAIAAVTLEAVATRSPYLAYQLRSSTSGLSLRDLQVTVAGAGLALLLGLVRSPSNRPHPHSHRRLGTILALASAAFGAVYFVRANYAHPVNNLVRAIVAFDRNSGVIDWVLEDLADPMQPIDGRNSPATPTPATDGKVVCAYFGSPGLMCADWDGRQVWSRRDLQYDGMYGVASSPVLVNGVLVVARDLPEGVAHVSALDPATGATLWTRTFPTTPTFSGNSRTPIVHSADGRPVVVLWGMNYLKALALRSGDVVWTYDLDSAGDLVSSATADAQSLYLSDASGTIALDVASLSSGAMPVRWKNQARANCVSPVLVNGILFTITDSGVAVASRADTGETLWRHRLPGQYFPSLLASSDAVYFTNSDGLTTVVAADSTFRILAQNSLGEETMASMAAASGELYIRSAQHLYAVGYQ